MPASHHQTSQPAQPTQPTDSTRQLLDFIEASPSPWHVCAQALAQLTAQGFEVLDESQRWQLKPGGRYVVARDGSALIAFVIGSAPLADSGLRLIGAHTDSPGLRLKPRPVLNHDAPTRLAVEVYGCPILASFADLATWVWPDG